MVRRTFKQLAEDIAGQVRERLNLSLSAPLDPLKLAEMLSIEVLAPEQLRDFPVDCMHRLELDYSGNWSTVMIRSDKYCLIVLNTARTSTQSKSDLAHELAHIILRHKSPLRFVSPGADIAIQLYNGEQEEEAKWLSECLLLPRDALFYTQKRGLTDEEVCVAYGIDQALLRFRSKANKVMQMRRTNRFKRLRESQ
jgi:Zn-dependent peptidase ImmA (M78 family)